MTNRYSNREHVSNLNSPRRPQRKAYPFQDCSLLTQLPLLPISSHARGPTWPKPIITRTLTSRWQKPAYAKLGMANKEKEQRKKNTVSEGGERGGGARNDTGQIINRGDPSSLSSWNRENGVAMEGEGMGERRGETPGSTSRSHVKVAGNFRDRGGHVIQPRHKGGEGTKDPSPGSAPAISSGLDRFYTEIEKRI